MLFNIRVAALWGMVTLAVCVGIASTGHCQGKFRAKSVNNIPFILPPQAKLGKEGIFGNKQSLQFHSRFRYHRIIVKAIDKTSYESFESALRKATHEHDSKAITPARLLSDFETTDYHGDSLNPSARVFFSDKNDGFILELDYGQVMTAGPAVYFNDLSAQLLKLFLQKETGATAWPAGICQEIVWKIYSLLPVPVSSATAALGQIRTTAYSLLLLHPRIALRVDHTVLEDRTVRLAEGASEPNWKYVMTGQSIIHLDKVQNSKGEVFFRQLPFLHRDIDRSLLYDNTYRESFVHQSSSGDLELSARTSIAPFLFLYLRHFQGNNSGSTPPSSTIDDCCRFDKGMHCNSLLLFRGNLNELITPVDYCTTEIKDYASFGQHALIAPVIPVYIDGGLTYQPLGLKLSDLVRKNVVTTNNKLEREYRNEYTLFKKKNNNVCLLPGDRITNR